MDLNDGSIRVTLEQLHALYDEASDEVRKEILRRQKFMVRNVTETAVTPVPAESPLGRLLTAHGYR